MYDRPLVIRVLGTQEASPAVVSENFSIHQLAPNAVLLTYRSAHRRSDGSLEKHTLRSSVWLKSGSQWQLRYHQGTPAAELW